MMLVMRHGLAGSIRPLFGGFGTGLLVAQFTGFGTDGLGEGIVAGIGATQISGIGAGIGATQISSATL